MSMSILTKRQLQPLLVAWGACLSTLPSDLNTPKTYGIPIALRDTDHSGARIVRRSSTLYEVTWIHLEREPLCSICRRPGQHNHPCE